MPRLFSCKFGIHPWKRNGKYPNGKRKYACRFGCGAVGRY